MEEKSLIIKIFGLYVDITICGMIFLTCLLIFLFVYFCSRNLQIKPTRQQNVLEMIIAFVRKIVSDNLTKAEVNNHVLLGLTLFLFILCANLVGLTTKIAFHNASGEELNFWKSPTADPVVTLTLAVILILSTHFFGMRKFGVKVYLINSFLKPAKFLLPINLMKEFTNVLTLGLRLYGNIFAGEVLLTLIATLATSKGILSFIPALPLQMTWIGFSIFIGAIQAYIFVTLSMVYLANKISS